MALMTRAQRTLRRTDALSKARIVEAAIEILDAHGESALTFRALTARLTTGSGALYWHVADKNDLLAAATDNIVARFMTKVAGRAEPREALRDLALGVFDAIDAHPWVGAQLSREPWRPAALTIFEEIGGRLQALGRVLQIRRERRPALGLGQGDRSQQGSGGEDGTRHRRQAVSPTTRCSAASERCPNASISGPPSSRRC